MCWCLSGDDWKDEHVHDYKFSYINMEEFRLSSFWTWFKYSLMYLAILRGILIYMADIFTLYQYLINSSFMQNPGVKKLIESKPQAAAFLDIIKWIYLGSIFFSMVLVAFEARRCKNILQSDYVSYAFTSTMAYRMYSIKSFATYCFFQQVEQFKTGVDNIAYFVYFALRDYKRVFLSQLPRRLIDSFYLASMWTKCGSGLFRHFYYNFRKLKKPENLKIDPTCIDLGNRDLVELVLKIFTLFVFIFTAVRLLCAILAYIPLVCRIRGNLKEYCAHKIDKRIGELITFYKAIRINEMRFRSKERETLDRLANPFGTKKKFPTKERRVSPEEIAFQSRLESIGTLPHSSTSGTGYSIR